MIFEAECSGIENYIGIDVDILIDCDRTACEIVSEWIVGGDHASGFYFMLVLVDGEGAN